jgi:hypothetical protein
MSCHGPLHGWLSKERTPLGKRRMSFSIRESYHDLKLTVPCGQCTGCKLDRARAWSIRITHEASQWAANSFVTLTYKEMPSYGSLRPRDFVLFMKRLRKAHPGVRFLQAGEYGSKGRPHHHAILFNCSFPDATPFRQTPAGYLIYRSAELEKLWPHGYSSIGDVNIQTAAYVARYTLKKSGSEQRNPNFVKEYITMSRRPGIGQTWIKKYFTDVYPSDTLILSGGKKARPPRYYDNILERTNPNMYKAIKFKRINSIKEEEQSSRRLLAHKVNTERRITDYLKRSLR